MDHRFSEITAFLAVAHHLSFQKAAIARGVTRSAISHAVRNLEGNLGVRLLNRNTRNVSLTDAGRLLHARLQRAYLEIGDALDDVNRLRDTPQGTVRLTIPRAVGVTLMGPVIAALTKANPGLSLDISSDDSLVDIIEGGYDAGIRFGDVLQPNMIALKIKFPLHFSVVGSPTYLSGRTIPVHPSDLEKHSCIKYRFPSGTTFRWRFQKDDLILKVAVRGQIQLDDQELMIEAALSHAGLAYVFAERVQPYLKAGLLTRCLADWTPQFGELFLYYPKRAHQPAALRALIDTLKRLDRIGHPLLSGL